MATVGPGPALTAPPLDPRRRLVGRSRLLVGHVVKYATYPLQVKMVWKVPVGLARRIALQTCLHGLTLSSRGKVLRPMPKLSAGLLPYKFAEDGSLAVLLVHPGGPFWKNKDAHAWSIPKGEYQEGEDPEQAADREFAEELGLPVPDGPRIDLGTIRQASGKYVRAWAVHAEHLVTDAVVSNRFEMEWPPKSGTMREFPEVDRARVDDDGRSHHPDGGGADGVALPAGGGTAPGPTAR